MVSRARANETRNLRGYLMGRIKSSGCCFLDDVVRSLAPIVEVFWAGFFRRGLPKGIGQGSPKGTDTSARRKCPTKDSNSPLSWERMEMEMMVGFWSKGARRHTIRAAEQLIEVTTLPVYRCKSLALFGRNLFAVDRTGFPCMCSRSHVHVFDAIIFHVHDDRNWRP